MTDQELELLLTQPEGPQLDWKKQLPTGLGELGAARDEARGELLKDIAALTNGLLFTSAGSARLVYGVKDLGSTRRVHGVSMHLDDADLQGWAANIFYHAPPFVLEGYLVEGRHVVVLTIARPARPVVPKRTLGPLAEGQVWVRRGTRNVVAGPEELEVLFGPVEPFVIGNLNDPVVAEIVAPYKASGQEVAFKRYTEKDALLTRAWQVVHYPGTRREVVVADLYGRIELVAMIKPRS